MSLFEPDEWSFTGKVLDLVATNPFDPSWTKQERELLGLPSRDAPATIAWLPGADLWSPHSVYSEELHQRIIDLGERLRRRLEGGASASEAELERYELLSIMYCLYCKVGEALDEFIDAAVRGCEKRSPDGRSPKVPDLIKIWDQFQIDYNKLLAFNHLNFPRKYRPEKLFAFYFLFRRAFYHIFFNIVGTSKPIAKLRSTVWESIVTHDTQAWMQGLHQRMKDIPTLITGPSGTGKERVAEAIGRSLYIAFDPKKAFAVDFLSAFQSVNPSALSPLLIESEMFGHVEGSFTGAVRDRIGRLEECPEQGAVFLDEIGELTAEIQVKLLRVLQTRCFQRVGASEDQEFRGRIIAATNRDLTTEIKARRFREDFYYRLCADQIETPSLRQQLDDRPEDLPLLVGHVCRIVVGEQQGCELAPAVVGWIEQHLRDYAWPGNFRELEQCVRSYTIRRHYHPLLSEPPLTDDPVKELANQVIEADGKLTLDAVKHRLIAAVYRRASTLQRAAKLLDVDPRTIGAIVNGKRY